jgi:putative transposase
MMHYAHKSEFLREKKETPTVAIVDSQSTKTVQTGNQHGYDAGKKTKGRKRHIAVDTLGLLLAVVVHAASIQDRLGVRALLLRLSHGFHSIIKIFADGGYTGKIIDWTLTMFGWVLVIIKRSDTGFKILPKRWVVERTFGWWSFYRRLSKDYEHRTDSSETMIKITMIRIMLCRLKVNLIT